jgi:DNA-binding PucR family transcriptional regulator
MTVTKKIIGRPRELNDSVIQEILKLYRETDMGYVRIAKRLNLHVSTVGYYVRKYIKKVNENM